MSKSVALQADVGNLPSNGLLLLEKTRPLLKALSSDNVQPLAVLQTQAIGACFHINGDMAAKVSEFLARSSSSRLDRIVVLVGWMAGDTAVAMAQTSGGRAAALLSLVLVDLYGQDHTGVILQLLASKILPADATDASFSQLGAVAGKLHNKLVPLAFGKHLATHVTRIIQTYADSGLEIPPTLMDQLPSDTMAEFLEALHTALREENAILYVEGYQALGPIVALVTALCPNDVTINVEDEQIFKVERQNIVISIKSQIPTHFRIEAIVSKRKWSDIIVSPSGSRGDGKRPMLSGYDHLSMSLDGYLSNLIDMTLAELGAARVDLRFAIVELITAIVFSFTFHDFQPGKPDPKECLFPSGGFKSLLGPGMMNRVRDKLKMLFEVEPSMTAFDVLKAYMKFHDLVKRSLPHTGCPDQSCFHAHPWSFLSEPHCMITEFWRAIGRIIGNALILLFVDHAPDAYIDLGWSNKLGPEVCFAIMRRLHTVTPEVFDRPTAMILSHPNPRIFDVNPFLGTGYTITDLHRDICTRIDPTGVRPNTIGVCNGSHSVFPSTLTHPELQDPRYVVYILADGQFYHRGNFYRRLESDIASVRSKTDKPVPTSGPGIGASDLGVHSTLTMTTRPHLDTLLLHTIMQVSTKTIELNFLHLHLASMGLSFAKPCSHQLGLPLEEGNVGNILTSTVEAPLATGDRISIVLTHRNPEAQFLCGMPDVPMLFQGRTCLNCAVKEAKERGFKMIIQS